MDLQEAIKKEGLGSYVRLRGGFPVPLAGVVYWLILGILGYYFMPYNWSLIAFILSGAIFPLALLFAKLFKNNFMKDKNAVIGVIAPAFVSMLLFWPLALAAFWTEIQLVPLILAIGMSIHWPVIGWSYDRTLIFSGHAIVRAVSSFLIWYFLPDERFTLLPFSVAAIYLVTVIVVWIDSGKIARQKGRIDA